MVMVKKGQADTQYKKVIDNILENGYVDDPDYVRPVYEDGEKATTKAVFNVQMKYDNSGDEALLLTTKKAPRKDPITEARWIWQLMSNNVQELRDMGCNVWNEWEQEDGTIGKAYGWQLANKKQKVIVDDLFIEMTRTGQFSFSPSKEDWETGSAEESMRLMERIKGLEVHINQVDFLLYSLQKNPYSRSIIVTLYAIEDLDDMALKPCVYETQWKVYGGKLNVEVSVRSNDLALGNPYNVYQYSVLHKVIAQVSGLMPGEMVFSIFDGHLYERHIETMKEQMANECYEPATITINPEVTSFYEFTEDDVIIEGYESHGKYEYEVAI